MGGAVRGEDSFYGNRKTYVPLSGSDLFIVSDAGWVGSSR